MTEINWEITTGTLDTVSKKRPALPNAYSSEKTKLKAVDTVLKNKVTDTTKIKKESLLGKLKLSGTDSDAGDTLRLTTVDWMTWVEYSDLYGPIFNVWVQKTNKKGTFSLILKWSIWEQEKRALAWAGWEVWENGKLSIMWEYLKQQRKHTYLTSNIDWVEKTDEFDAIQNKFWINFKLDTFELWGSYSKSKDVRLADTQLIVNTDVVWKMYNEQNEFVGQEAISWEVANTFDIWKNADLRLAAWMSSIDSEVFFDAWADYNLYMWKNGKISLDYHRKWETDQYGASYEWNVFDTWMTYTAKASHIEGPDYDDTRWSLMLNIPLGKRSKKDFKKPSSGRGGDLESSLRSYVEREKSYQVLWEIEKTGQTLLSEIDKTWIPSDAEIDIKSWDIIVNWLNTFTTFTSMTINGSAYVGPAFTVLWGDSLHIDMSDLAEPTNGTDTYVLTTDGTPANTITIVVAKGSIIIKSIDVEVQAPNISSISFPWIAPDTKDTAYTNLVLQTDQDIASIAWLISTNGWAITNVSIINWNQIQFDWAWCGTADTFFQLTATWTNGNEVTVDVRQLLPNEIAPNIWAPTIQDPVLTQSVQLVETSPNVWNSAQTGLDLNIWSLLASDPDGLGAYAITSALFGQLASWTWALPTDLTLTAATLAWHYSLTDTITITTSDNHPTNPQTSTKTVTVFFSL